MSQRKENAFKLNKDNLLSSGLTHTDSQSYSVSGSDDDKSTLSLVDNSDKNLITLSTR